MAPDDPDRPYTVYRSRPKLLGRREDGRDDELAGLRRKPDRSRPAEPAPPRRRRRLRPGRILAFVLLAALGWVLVSLVLFLVSAQIQRGQVADSARDALDPAGFTATDPNTILVLGSDARTEENAEPGSTRIGEGGSRSDSILLLRIGGGHNATLSIPRDTVVDIPGFGRNKINAAYALGGAALAIRTVEEYLGIEVNHLVEVNFENFPSLIDALGGITYTGGCVRSRINGGFRNGGYTLRLRRGTHELDGRQALALARTRTNLCDPSEDDRARVRRQQKILAAMKDKITSLETFVRLPWVSWAAPQAVRTDLAGPGLLGVVAATVTGGESRRQVLRPSATTILPDGGQGLLVDPARRDRAVERFLRR